MTFASIFAGFGSESYIILSDAVCPCHIPAYMQIVECPNPTNAWCTLEKATIEILDLQV